MADVLKGGVHEHVEHLRRVGPRWPRNGLMDQVPKRSAGSEAKTSVVEIASLVGHPLPVPGYGHGLQVLEEL
eukprot:4657190-Prorocentrum_lima.AAC.1